MQATVLFSGFPIVDRIRIVYLAASQPVAAGHGKFWSRIEASTSVEQKQSACVDLGHADCDWNRQLMFGMWNGKELCSVNFILRSFL